MLAVRLDANFFFLDGSPPALLSPKVSRRVLTFSSVFGFRSFGWRCSEKHAGCMYPRPNPSPVDSEI